MLHTGTGTPQTGHGLWSRHFLNGVQLTPEQQENSHKEGPVEEMSKERPEGTNYTLTPASCTACHLTEMTDGVVNKAEDEQAGRKEVSGGKLSH